MPSKTPKEDRVKSGPVQGIESNCCDDISKFIKDHNIKTVVETGVYYGHSTQVILDAIPKDGCLVSVEISPFKLETLYVRKEHHDKWLYIYGSSDKVLPTLFKRFGHFDFFWHDSWHRAAHMKFEYELAAKYCKYIGSHDINHPGAGTAWSDFIKKYKVKELVHRSKWALGVFEK